MSSQFSSMLNKFGLPYIVAALAAIGNCAPIKDTDSSTTQQLETRQLRYGSFPVIDDGSAFNVKIGLGISNQFFLVQADTGSSDLWVPSAYLQANAKGKHTTFAYDKSTSFSRIPNQYGVANYGTGGGSPIYFGVVGTDNIWCPDGSWSVPNVVLEVATSTWSGNATNPRIVTGYPAPFVNTSYDGIMGLGPSGYRSGQQTDLSGKFIKPANGGPGTPAHDLAIWQRPCPQDGSVDCSNWDPVLNSKFATYFPYGKQQTLDLFIDQTGPDTNKFSGVIQYVDVIADNGWYITSPTFSVGGTRYTVSGTTKVLLDSGTTMMMVPKAVGDAIFGPMGGSYNSQLQAYVYPCNAAIPKVGFSMGPTNQVNPGINYAYLTTNPQAWARPGISTGVPNQCVSYFAQNAPNAAFSFFGTLFFRSNYLTFQESTGQITDWSNPTALSWGQIGYAPIK